MKPIHSVADLVAAGLIAPERAESLAPVVARYPLAITPALAALIDPADPADPIAKAFIPTPAELDVAPEERADPIGDGAHSPCPGVVHRHPDRLLFSPVLACPVYCRFCFRRAAVGHAHARLTAAETAAALAYIAAHREVWEVILTGGDPLVLGAAEVSELAARLAAIDHVKVVRWHTRLPVVAPERLDAAFVRALNVPGKAVVVALHADHPRELTAAARAACARLIDAGIVMVSQSVLLKGVNDEVETLAALMRAFVETRIKPYYLHHPDLARGTAHFRVRIEEGIALMRALRGRVSGLCMPHYVLDIPGGFAKVPLDSGSVEKTATGWRIRDHAGVWHEYP